MNVLDRFRPSCLRLAMLGALAGLLAAGAAQAQPFTAWMNLVGEPMHGGVQIPHSSALNPTAAFTFEAWVSITGGPYPMCGAIAGKNHAQAWGIFACTRDGKRSLESNLKGPGSYRAGGEIPNGVWTHVAVVFNGTHRLHYINGELAASFPETGPLTINTDHDPMRIGSDVSFPITPTGSIDEVRLWNVARTVAQIRANLNRRINVAQPGLVAVWALDGNANDIIGPHDGIPFGDGVSAQTFAPFFNCDDTATLLCVEDEHFQIRAFWRTNPTPGTTTDGSAQVAVWGANSGLFWFFSPANWEIMVKVLDGCGLNDRYWVFSAATTNVFYRMEVWDVRAGEQKIYFNYPGPPAPAVTDTSAIATCP